MKTMIQYDDYEKIQICTGTVLTAELNPKARKPAYVLTIDFGPYGIKKSSAQITENYTVDQLVGKQIVAILNFPPKRVAEITSEVLVLGAVSPMAGVVLLEPTKKVEDGVAVA